MARITPGNGPARQDVWLCSARRPLYRRSSGRGGQRAGRGQTPGGQRRTGVPARTLRYYEEQDLLHPERSGNGYRTYSESAVYRVQQIRGLLDSGLTTEIIRTILPYLNSPDEIHVHPRLPDPADRGTVGCARGGPDPAAHRLPGPQP